MTPTLFRHLATKAFSAVALSAMMLLAACGSSSTATSTGGSSTTPATPTVPAKCTVVASDLTLSPTGSAATVTATAGLSGKTLAIDGSSALAPLFKDAATTFDKANGTSTSVTANGSGTGIKDSAAGTVQIGMSDIFFQESSAYTQNKDAYTTLVDHQVAVVAFALVVSDDLKSKITDLTSQQITDIYTGKITDWSAVGGPAGTITIVNRPAGSGTRGTFDKYVLNGAKEAQGNTLAQDSTGALVKAIQNSPGSIGYAATGFVLDPTNTGINPICIDGVSPTSKNINAGTYKFWSYEHAYTKGQPDAVSQAFLDFVNSAAFQGYNLPAKGFLKVGDLTSAAKTTHPAPTN